MDIETKLEFVHSVLIKHNQQITQAKKPRHLNKLKMFVLRSALLNEGSYQTIADSYNYTEGHVKKVAYELWKELSEIWGVKVSKDNLLSVIETELQKQHKNLPPSPPIILHHKAHDFIGRDTAINDINNLVNEGRKIIVIQAAGGVGKTRFAQEYIKTQNFDIVIPLLMAKKKENISTVESVSEDWLKTYFQEEPGTEFGVNLQKLRRQLQTQKVGILIDNLEPALDKQGRFIEKHRGYIEILRVLSDATVQSVTLITSREPVYENLETETYLLPSLNQPDWKEFFASHNINADEQTLSEIHKAYGGNALAMKVLCDPIIRYYDRNIESYWYEHKISGDLLVELAVQNLINEQFNRLQKLDYEVYKLLCRLGCYRYQDIPKVPIEALLCLLWDIPDEKQRRYVINSLRSRCLVEFEKGKYWLHPVIKEQGVERLKESGEWEQVNRKAAEFWTESVEKFETIDDVTLALESYYLYLQIGDIEKAREIIVQSRINKFNEAEHLGNAIMRFGLLEKLINLITQVTEIDGYSFNLAKLYNILGTTYRLTGKIKIAIECYRNSREISGRCLEDKNYITKFNSKDQFWIKRMNTIALLHQGMCYLELYELEQSLVYFEELFYLINQNKDNRDNTHKIGLWEHEIDQFDGLAYINSCFNKIAEAEKFATITYQRICRVGINSWGKSFEAILIGMTYKNLGDIDKAFEMYFQALNFSENYTFLQTKGKCLYCLAELYRIKNDFEKALPHHSESIKLLDKIGAKCDLAEAYYQLGLTYQKMGETETSHTNFNEAIRLFNEMEAPKQVEKVEKAIRGNID
ncbi:MAG: tetratricopeptide repeat protein [Dolichospermum sp. DEX182a]|nr:tetratricopeptide repeat protein [Dolichospermum sp. DEX182a]